MKNQQAILEKAHNAALEANRAAGIELSEPDKEAGGTKPVEGSGTTQPTTEPVATGTETTTEPDKETKPVAAKKKAKRKTKKKVKDNVAETQPAIEPATTETAAETELTKDKEVRPGHAERNELKANAEYEKRIAALERQLQTERTLTQKEYNRRVELEAQRQAQPERKVSSVTDFANASITKYRDGLKNQIDTNGGDYRDVNNNKITKEEAVLVLEDVNRHLEMSAKQTQTHTQTQSAPYDDPSLDLPSQWEQSPVEYSQRVSLSNKFAESEFDPAYVENFDPDLVEAISSLDDDDQQLVITGFGSKFALADSDPEVKDELLKVGAGFNNAKTPFELVKRVVEFKNKYMKELGELAVDDDDGEEYVEPTIRPGGKPTAGSREQVPSTKYTGNVPGPGEKAQDFFNRMEREAEQKAAKRYGLRV